MKKRERKRERERLFFHRASPGHQGPIFWGFVGTLPISLSLSFNWFALYCNTELLSWWPTSPPLLCSGPLSLSLSLSLSLPPDMEPPSKEGSGYSEARKDLMTCPLKAVFTAVGG